VDAVVQAFLGGDVSSVTRSVLLTGRNPLLDAAPSGEPPTPMRPAPQPAPARANTPAPALRGLAQVVGLALGSPEFQRR